MQLVQLAAWMSGGGVGGVGDAGGDSGGGAHGGDIGPGGGDGGSDGGSGGGGGQAEQTRKTASKRPQLWTPQGLLGQSASLASEPEHWRLSR